MGSNPAAPTNPLAPESRSMVTRSDLKGRIQTVRGLIDPAELGPTLMH